MFTVTMSESDKLKEVAELLAEIAEARRSGETSITVTQQQATSQSVIQYGSYALVGIGSSIITAVIIRLLS